MGVNRLIVFDTNPLRVRIENGRIIKIMNANFCIFDFYFSLEAMPEAPRSETLVADLRPVLASLQPETMCWTREVGMVDQVLFCLSAKFSHLKFSTNRLFEYSRLHVWVMEFNTAVQV